MLDQFVALFTRRLAIVAGHGELQITGNQASAQGLHLLQHGFGQGGGVGACALGKGDGHGVFKAVLASEQHHRRFRIVAIDHAGHIAQIDRTAILDGHHKPVQFPGLQHESRRLQRRALVSIHQRSGGQLHLGGLQGRLKLADGQAEGAQTIGIGLDADHAPRAPVDLHLGRAGHRAQLPGEHIRQRAELPRRLLLAMQGQRQEGHIIDGEQLHDGLHRAGWQDLGMGQQFLMHLHQAGLLGFVHLEADRQ